MLDKAMKEVDKRSKGLGGMIERAEEMIPRKDNVLSPKRAWDKKPEDTKKILGNTLHNNIVSNDYLKRAKDVLDDHI